MLINNLKLIVRKLRKEKLYAVTNILGLTIGLISVLLIALYVRDELSFDKFHANKEGIYRVISSTENRGIKGRIPSDFVDYFKEDVPEIEDYTRMSKVAERTLIDANDKQLNVPGVLMIDPNFFDFFSFALVNASNQGVFSESGQAVISQSLSQRMFGSIDPIGQEILVEKGNRYIISAVAEDAPKNSTIQFDLLLYRQGYFKNDFERMHGYRTAITYVFSNTNMPSRVAQKIADTSHKTPYSRIISKDKFSLLPLTDQRLNASYKSFDFEKNDILYVRLFSGIGIVILLLALINYVNLVTAQSIRRMREMGIRKIIGAEKRQLIFYQVLESYLLTVVAFLLAFAVSERLMSAFNLILDKDISIEYFSLEFFIWTVITSLLIGVIAGLYPAFYISKVRPLALLKKEISSNRSGSWLRKGLILFQFIVSALLVSVLAIMSNQMSFLKQKELGYNTDFVLSVPLDRDSTHLYEKLRTSFRSIAGVQNTSLSGFRIGGGYVTGVLDGSNTQGEGAKAVAQEVVYADASLMPTLGLEFYWKSETYDPGKLADDQMLINYTLAEKLGWLAVPEGKRLFGWNDVVGREVVGVLSDFHLKSLKTEVEPIVILPLGDWGTDNLLIKMEGGAGLNSFKEMASQFESLFDRPFEYHFLDDQIAGFYKKEEGQFMLFKIFSGLALFISLLGLVALTVYTVEQRRKEVSIRKVLGASIHRLILLLNKEYGLLIVIAFSIATPIAWYLMKEWLSVFVYRIGLNPIYFVVAFLGVLILSFLTVLLQSYRACSQNPAEVLRND